MIKKTLTALAATACVAAASFSAMADDATLTGTLNKAKDIIAANGWGDAGVAALQGASLTDLDGSGLHVFAFTKDGKVVFDLSGQTTPGMDLAGIADMEGNVTADYVKEVSEGKGGGFYRSQASWPHPTKGTMSPSTFYCETVDNNSLCTMMWLN